jgi:hypothetical protein
MPPLRRYLKLEAQQRMLLLSVLGYRQRSTKSGGSPARLRSVGD